VVATLWNVKRAQPAPGAFARAVSDDIRKELGSRRLSRRELARNITMSEPYLRDRLNDVFPLTLNDAEMVYTFFGIEPGARLAKIEREMGPSTVLHFPNVTGSRDADPLGNEQYAANTDGSLPHEQDYIP
jgi:hypothetical protein